MSKALKIPFQSIRMIIMFSSISKEGIEELTNLCIESDTFYDVDYHEEGKRFIIDAMSNSDITQETLDQISDTVHKHSNEIILKSK